METRSLVIRKGCHEQQVKAGGWICVCVYEEATSEASREMKYEISWFGMGFWFSVHVALYNF